MRKKIAAPRCPQPIAGLPGQSFLEAAQKIFPHCFFFLLFLVSWRAVTSLWVRAAVFPDCSWGGVTSVRGAHLAARSTTQGKAESGTA